MTRGKVIVGMSGGVDSSVAAYLLKEQGYEVLGVTMETWRESGDCGQSPAEDARRVAALLDIPFYVLDLKKEFKESVVDYFVREYLQGRTPNPCVACNRFVKWEALLHRARDLGADYIATGHYARIRRLANGRYAVSNSASGGKDQTYALYGLTQEQLRRTLMPVGSYTKPEIRQLAEKIGLPVADKRDSQEICFVPDQDYAGFIGRYAGVSVPEGNFVTENGEILGRHRGIIHYTIGQRRGLGLPMGRRVFVREIRPDTNEVVIGEGDQVFSGILEADRVNYMGVPELEMGESIVCTAKIRYGHKGAPCVVTRTGQDRIRCEFWEPVRAVTPGQAVVFYQEDFVAGGGTIL